MILIPLCVLDYFTMNKPECYNNRLWPFSFGLVIFYVLVNMCSMELYFAYYKVGMLNHRVFMQ